MRHLALSVSLLVGPEDGERIEKKEKKSSRIMLAMLPGGSGLNLKDDYYMFYHRE